MDDFIDKLSVETHLSRMKAENLVHWFYNSGLLEDAIKAYDDHGIAGLYIFM